MYSRVYILNLSDADGQRFLLISPFDVVDLFHGLRVLGQTRQAVDGVCGHSDDVAPLQSLRRAA